MDFETREIKKMEMKNYREPKEKKKSLVATVFIVFLLILNVLLSSYILYDKGIISDIYQSFFGKEQTNQEEKDSVKKLSLDDEVVQTVYSYLLPLKRRFAMTSSLSKSELSEEEKFVLALSLLKEEDYVAVDEKGMKYQLKPELINEAGSKIIGDETISGAMFHDSIYLSYSKDFSGKFSFRYDLEQALYLVTVEKMDEMEEVDFYTKLSSAYIKKDQLVLTEKALYTLEEDGKKSLYRDWQLASLIGDFHQEELSKYWDEASEISYVFQKKGEHYQFVSSEINEKN